MRNDRENLIVDLSFQFALKIISFSELLENKKKFVISRQLLKSGTSIGANVREAQNAERKADFVHKLKVAAKEADETEYWLLLCDESQSYPGTSELRKELTSIIKVLSKIIGSVKRSNRESSNSITSKSSNQYA